MTERKRDERERKRDRELRKREREGQTDRGTENKGEREIN